jgi:hypothetical protein
MKRNFFMMAFVSLFTVVALCSCSKDDDENDDNGGNGGSTGLQGNILTVAVENGASYSTKIDVVQVKTENSENVFTSVPYNNGRFTLTLPVSVSDEYFFNLLVILSLYEGLTVSNPNAKGCEVYLDTYKSDANTGYLYPKIGDWTGKLIYMDGDLSVSGSITGTDKGATVTDKYNYHLKKGWNMVYVKETVKANDLYEVEHTTQAPEGVKWYFHEFK